MRFCIYLVLITLPLSAFASEECSNGYWSEKGNVGAMVKAYDDLINSLPDKKDPAPALNAFIRSSGLPFMVGLSSADSKESPDRLEGDDPSGTVAAVFMKVLKLKKGSNLTLDPVYEVKKPDAKAALLAWNIPYNASMPIVGIDGDELILRSDLTPLCSGKTSKSVWVGVKPSGEYRILAPKPTGTLTSLEQCAAKGLIKNSGYGTCSEVIDLKSKAKHILVWQTPMT